MNLIAARALLYYVMFAPTVPYIQLAVVTGDWGMLGGILLSMCQPLAIGIR